MKFQIAAIALTLASFSTCAETAVQSFPALGSTGGRYVFGQLSEFQKDKFLLDTQTGRVWIMICTDDKGAQCWRGFQSVPFMDGNGNRLSTAPTPAINGK